MEFKLPFSTILEAFEMMKFLGYDVKSRKTKVSDFYTCNINGIDYNVELVIVNGKYHYIEIETFGEEEQLEDIEAGFRHILSLVSLDYEDRDARKWHEIIGE